MHYERAPQLRKVNGWRRLRSATLCGASLRSGGERVSVCGKKAGQEGLGKSAGEWHCTLGEDKRWHE